MTTINAFVKKTVDLDKYKLVNGVGKRTAKQLCVMSLAALLAGEAHGDEVSCACPVVRAFAIRLNDRLPSADRQKLKVVAVEILGTKGSRALEQRRMYRCADWAVREVAAGALEAAGLVENALALRALAPIVDKATAELGRDEARKGRAAAAYAAAYAYAADYAADYAAAYAAYAADAAADYAADAAAADAAYAADAAAAYAAYAADAAADAVRTSHNERAIAFLRELCSYTEEV